MRNRIALILVVTAIAQGVILGMRHLEREPEALPYRTLSVGDTVQALSGSLHGGTGTRFSLARADGRATVLLAFNSKCGHCEKIAPAWRDWLQAPRPADVVVLSREPVDTAWAYHERHRWSAPLLSVNGSVRYSSEHLLVSKVPWVAVFDSRGVLRLFEHGGELSRVDSVVAQLEAARRSPSRTATSR